MGVLSHTGRSLFNIGIVKLMDCKKASSAIELSILKITGSAMPGVFWRQCNSDVKSVVNWFLLYVLVRWYTQRNNECEGLTGVYI